MVPNLEDLNVVVLQKQLTEEAFDHRAGVSISYSSLSLCCLVVNAQRWLDLS
jgi:hypothetical protein